MFVRAVLSVIILLVHTAKVHTTQVRLVGGSHPWEGTIQIYHSGWGTICDDGFGEAEARVICRMLGFDEPVTAYSNAHFGTGSGYILLDDLNCDGSETDVTQCMTKNWKEENCEHTEDAGVRCTHITFPRLVGGSGNFEGTVQVDYNERPYTICDRHFTDNDAKVICRSLGFNGGVAVTGGKFGEISYARILSDNLGCSGNETRFQSCSRYGLHSTSCTHAQDVGVTCDHTPVRLVGGSTPSQGLLQIQFNGVWSTVCSKGFDSREANVVCRMLGFNGSHVSMETHTSGGSGPVLSGNLGCQGNEVDLGLCSALVWDNNCTHTNDVGLTCSPTDVRLTGGSGPWEGTLEIKVNNRWGTVCDPDFGDAEAQVVCRMLGYTKKDAVHIVYHSDFFGHSYTPIFDNITCSGHENDINACAKVFHTTCSSSETVGLRCEGVQVRLANGAHSGQGRVEVLHGGQWGSICDSNWDDKDATVICKMITPYPYDKTVTGKALSGSMFGYGIGRVWLSDVNCHGNESDITDCNRDTQGGINCDHSNDAGVICNTEITKRLIGGATDSEGTVEYLNNLGRWMSYCQEGWNTTDGKAVCTELGYWNNYPIVRYDSYFGRGNGSTYKTRPECTGNEGSLEMCQAEIQLGAGSSCSNTLAVGVSCNPRSMDNSQIRLVDGPGPWKGRLEVKTNGVWGSFCYDFWNQSYTNLVCKTLHYIHLHGQSFPTSKGFGAVHYRSLECSQTDGNVGYCKANSNVSQCTHPNTRAVGIDCSDNESVRLENNIVKLYSGNSTDETHLCFNGINNSAAKVLCAMAGYPNSIPWREAVSAPSSNTHTAILCDGWESHIAQCRTRPGGTCSSRLKLRCFNCTREFTTSSGNLLSDNYIQGSYNSNEDCLYVIRPSRNMTLKLHFNDLDLFGDGDSVEIRDGYKGRQLGYYTGNSNIPYLVSDTGFYLRFKTNSYGEARGFNASWSELNVQDAINMGCGPDGWDIAVNTTILRHLYPDTGVSQIKLSDQQCTGVVDGDMVLFKQSYTECSSNIQTNANNVLYTNELVYPEASTPFPIVVRGYRWKVEVECDVPRQDTVSTGFKPNRTVINSVPHVTGSTHYSSSMKFYTDASYFKEINGNPVSLKTGEDVFVKVQLNSNDPHVKMRLDTCYAKPELNSPPSLTYILIKNGCLVDSYTNILSQGIHDTRFVFNAFEFPAGHENVYISCNATYCQTNDVSSACNQICMGAPQIIGRSVDDIWNDWETLG